MNLNQQVLILPRLHTCHSHQYLLHNPLHSPVPRPRIEVEEEEGMGGEEKISQIRLEEGV